jgi:decaprenyl-phosphate phosphoribosyltransferase
MIQKADPWPVPYNVPNANEEPNASPKTELPGLAGRRPKESCLPRIMKMSPYLQALRPQQWSKNFVVFAAMIFSFKVTWLSLCESVFAFAVFSALSSSFYLLNDIVDVKSDRLHPIKCKRPIAAGKITTSQAIAMAALLGGIALSVSWLYNPLLGIVLVLYALIQAAYNVRLKHIPIWDILAIAFGFALRALAGGAATGIHVSAWFILCTVMLALFLAIEKRKAELRLCEGYGETTRKVLTQYSISLLTRMESSAATMTLMSYALWSSGPQFNGASTPWMMTTFPFVLYGIFRYQLLSDLRVNDQEAGLGADIFQPTMTKTTILQLAPCTTPANLTERPEDVLLADRQMKLTVILWLCSVYLILFLKSQGLIT